MQTELYGLVLSGGKSMRMGLDKSTISYHGIPQREYIYRLLDGICTKTFLSIREDQQMEIASGINCIMDRNSFKGPYNGLLSAHEAYPNVAWLVMACDMPLMNSTALQQLVAARRVGAMATAFATRESGLPEPLGAIWEPQGLQDSIAYLQNGTSSCPRKFLIASDVELVFPEDENVLINANSQEDYREVMTKFENFKS